MGVHGLIDAVCHFMKRTSNYSITLCPARLSVLAKQTDQIECQCVKDTVTGFSGRHVFFFAAWSHFVCFPSEIVLQHLNENR